MDREYLLSAKRLLTEEEQKLMWDKPKSHIISDIERRICKEVVRNWNKDEMRISNILLEGDAGSGKTQLAKALSWNFGLPYTKVTCFADMDKSDVLGSILPILSDEGDEPIRYKYYPSEIVRAFENGWVLEIQEPTVIRDAAVLMALNSALESEGSINLPDRIVKRHRDFIAIITTNRGYNGCRPLNEALRDRIQHSEKMDNPPVEIMVERAKSKTNFKNEKLMLKMAETIILLDETAKSNGIKGVSGMRSYIFWVDSVKNGISVLESIYHKVIYKITTDKEEIEILEEALRCNDMLEELRLLEDNKRDVQANIKRSSDEAQLNVASNLDFQSSSLRKEKAINLLKSEESKSKDDSVNGLKTNTSSKNMDGKAITHQFEFKNDKIDLKEYRKTINKETREVVKNTIHEKVKTIVHIEQWTKENIEEYDQKTKKIMPMVGQMIRRINPYLEHEISQDYDLAKLYGEKFCANKLAIPDLRYFAQKSKPSEEPSIIVGVRIDESASMSALGRIEAAKETAIAIYEFCSGCNIPILISGDTADKSSFEQMSIHSYVDFSIKDDKQKYSLMNIKARSNNRDGMALKIMAQQIVNMPQKTKFLISISDGQPKAMPDYSGEIAIKDMQKIISEYRRKGVTIIAAAIGQDKNIISDIYGKENTIDIGDLKQLPIRLVKIIASLL